MSKEFDYIIVGGGTAGCVIASRLSAALPNASILVVEAGPNGDPRLWPTQGYDAGVDENIEWNLWSTPQIGFDGKVVTQITNSGKPRNYPLSGMVKAAYESTGVGWIPYINTGDPIGYSEGAQNTYNGFRQYSAKCYLFGDNVTVWNHAITEKLLVARKNVMGVRVLRNSGDCETVDCGLWTVGIGPATELKSHNIHQIADLPVGENFSDHPFFHTFWKVRDRGLSLGDMPMVTPECDWTAGLPIDWMTWHRHDEEVKKHQGEIDKSMYEWVSAEKKPHTESFVLYDHIGLSHMSEPHPSGSTLVLGNVLVAPTARGTLTLSSSDPSAPPILDPNALSNDLDTQLMYAIGRLPSP
ncbi:hypothetical protein B0J14DRAFT_654204 [Halenospora varia]|nr:hypothetical protein B0J14DRAFT_654204 [Halenospora varia]